jgi:hypothetical protein
VIKTHVAPTDFLLGKTAFNGGAREIVPDAIEIDPLASVYKPLCVRTVKVEMPQCRVSDDLIPGLDAWERGVHDDELLNLVWIKCA